MLPTGKLSPKAGFVVRLLPIFGKQSTFWRASRDEVGNWVMQIGVEVRLREKGCVPERPFADA